MYDRRAPKCESEVYAISGIDTRFTLSVEIETDARGHAACKVETKYMKADIQILITDKGPRPCASNMRLYERMLKPYMDMDMDME